MTDFARGSEMKRGFQLAVAAGLLAASGVLMANGFDDGIPENWVCEGNCGTSGADGVVTLAPDGGEAYGWVSSDEGVTDIALEGVGGDGNPTNGSRLRSGLFEVDAGEELEFQFNYVTSDGGGFADYAWARLLDENLQEVALLFTARTSSDPDESTVPGFEMPDIEATIDPAEVLIIPDETEWSPLGSDSGTCFSTGCGYTDWVQSNYVIADSGTYVLEFGVVNWDDQSFDSGMAFDGITVGGEPIDPGPAPGDPELPDDPVSIPTLSQMGLILASMLILLMGLMTVRGRMS